MASSDFWHLKPSGECCSFNTLRSSTKSSSQNDCNSSSCKTCFVGGFLMLIATGKLVDDCCNNSLLYLVGTGFIFQFKWPFSENRLIYFSSKCLSQRTEFSVGVHSRRLTNLSQCTNSSGLFIGKWNVQIFASDFLDKYPDSQPTATRVLTMISWYITIFYNWII